MGITTSETAKNTRQEEAFTLIVFFIKK